LTDLKDLVVIELASVLAGPGVGQFFAELGAGVIKVENLRTSGDVTRSWKARDENTDDRSAYFCSVNWGKQSIALDLTSSEGQSIAHQLSRKADIIIASYKPGDAEKLRVDYNTLSQDNPGLIYGQITGYGTHNQRVGYDAIIQAETGFMSMNGEPGGRSLKMPVALVDVLAGHHLKEGLLLAMLEKQRTGRGKLVSVSLVQSAVASLANQATNYLVGGKIPGKQGSAHPNIAPYGDVFTTADNKEILLAVGTDRQFEQLTNLLNIKDLIMDPRFKDNPSRVRHRPELNARLATAIGTMTSDQLMAFLQREKVPAGLVRNVKEALADPDVADLILTEDGLRGVRSFVASDATAVSHLLPPPHLGEHTRRILQEMLTFSPTAIDELLGKGIIG
jgi:crotonobetainyl-CoA:carnitine CoA-transferase CaiB-like acyl-CoA transferase